MLVAPVAAHQQPSFCGSVCVASTHHEDAYGCIGFNVVVDAFKPAIEPAQAESVEVNAGIRAEVSIAGIGMRLPAMRPRTHDQPLIVLGLGERGVVQV